MATFARSLACLAALLIVPALAVAADTQPATAPATSTKPKAPPKPPPPAYTDPEKLGVDFRIQGEYAAREDGSGIGVQIIGLRDKAGNVTFRTIIFPDGLPGVGAADGKNRIALPGKLVGDNAECADSNGSSITADGKTLTGKLADPATDLKLAKFLRVSPTMGAKPPEGAIVLFDGKDTKKFRNTWMDNRGLLAVGAYTLASYTDYTLHCEFILPYMPSALGQDRGNSGVYQQNRYEVQVLDSFGLVAKDDECGGIYKNAAPKINMCLPPLVWQTYDIDFSAPQWADGKKTRNAFITVKHNGVLIQDNVEIKGPTPGGNPKEDANPGPLYFQNHGNPVFYRNIWIVEKK